MKFFKGMAILLLCVGFVNHLIDQLAVTFGGEREILRIFFGAIGYAGFLFFWTKF